MKAQRSPRSSLTWQAACISSLPSGPMHFFHSSSASGREGVHLPGAVLCAGARQVAGQQGDAELVPNGCSMTCKEDLSSAHSK